MKKFRISLLLSFLLVVAMFGTANALTIVDTIDYWSSDASNYGEYQTLEHLFDNATITSTSSLTYVHDINDSIDVSAYTITSASLTLDFYDDYNIFTGVSQLDIDASSLGRDGTEIVSYKFDGTSWTLIGEIDTEADSDSVDDVVSLVVDVAFLQIDGKLTVALQVTGTGQADIKLDSSVLTVEAEAAPVPEPATMVLLGTGLVGLAGASRKKLFNKN